MYEPVKLLKHLETIAILFLTLASTCTVSNAAAEGNSDANELAALKGRAAATFSDYTTPQLFDVLQSKSANWYEREALASEFEKRPPEEVLPNLLPICFVPDTREVAYQDPTGFEAAQEAVWPIPMRYTALAAWHRITWGPQTRQKGMVLLKLLEQELPQKQTEFVLDALTCQFVPAAEPVLLQFVKNDASSSRECLLAARSLLRNQGNKHYEQFVKLAQESQFKRKRALFKMLSSRIVKREKPDERVTRLGLELLREQVAREPSRPRNAYDLLCDIEQYVGVKFYPYDERERYRRGHGGALTEAYFQEGVDNAMQWWKETRGAAFDSAEE